MGIQFEDIINVELNFSVLEKMESKLVAEKANLDTALNEDDETGLLASQEEIAATVDNYTKGMTEAQQQYEVAVKERLELREQIREMIGDANDPDSIRGLEAMLSYIQDSLPSDLEDNKRRRFDIVRGLFAELKKILALFEEFYGPVQTFVDTYNGSEATLDVAFEATLDNDNFQERFFDFVAQNRKGTFYGVEDGREALSALLSNVDFNSWPSMDKFLTTLTQYLSIDQRDGSKLEPRHIHDQLKHDNPTDFYDFVFGLDYLNPRYQITLNSKPLDDLSPGEKGALLLVFYLLVDKSDVPLLIDQPEENLDNQSIYSILCPFIRKARSRRQVILVTHNPNIAVAAGADQVVYCSIDKSSGNMISYETGALENPAIRQRIVDVLEGTMPAFQQREKKYALTE